MVKLIHFQGYPLQLLSMMVSGVPSMHICLDFIPELLAQPETHKQVHVYETIHGNLLIALQSISLVPPPPLRVLAALLQQLGRPC